MLGDGLRTREEYSKRHCKSNLSLNHAFRERRNQMDLEIKITRNDVDFFAAFAVDLLAKLFQD